MDKITKKQSINVKRSALLEKLNKFQHYMFDEEPNATHDSDLGRNTLLEDISDKKKKNFSERNMISTSPGLKDNIMKRNTSSDKNMVQIRDAVVGNGIEKDCSVQNNKENITNNSVSMNSLGENCIGSVRQMNKNVVTLRERLTKKLCSGIEEESIVVGHKMGNEPISQHKEIFADENRSESGVLMKEITSNLSSTSNTKTKTQWKKHVDSPLNNMYSRKSETILPPTSIESDAFDSDLKFAKIHENTPLTTLKAKLNAMTMTPHIHTTAPCDEKLRAEAGEEEEVGSLDTGKLRLRLSSRLKNLRERRGVSQTNTSIVMGKEEREKEKKEERGREKKEERGREKKEERKKEKEEERGREKEEERGREKKEERGREKKEERGREKESEKIETVVRTVTVDRDEDSPLEEYKNALKKRLMQMQRVNKNTFLPTRKEREECVLVQENIEGNSSQPSIHCTSVTEENQVKKEKKGKKKGEEKETSVIDLNICSQQKERQKSNWNGLIFQREVKGRIAFSANGLHDTVCALNQTPSNPNVKEHRTHTLSSLCFKWLGQCYVLSGHRDRILGLKVLNETKELVSISADNTFRVWSTSGKQPQCTSLVRVQGKMMSCYCSPDSVFCSSESGEMHVYDINTSRKRASYLAPKHPKTRRRRETEESRHKLAVITTNHNEHYMSCTNGCIYVLKLDGGLVDAEEEDEIEMSECPSITEFYRLKRKYDAVTHICILNNSRLRLVLLVCGRRGLIFSIGDRGNLMQEIGCKDDICSIACGIDCFYLLLANGQLLKWKYSGSKDKGKKEIYEICTSFKHCEQSLVKGYLEINEQCGWLVCVGCNTSVMSIIDCFSGDTLHTFVMSNLCECISVSCNTTHSGFEEERRREQCDFEWLIVSGHSDGTLVLWGLDMSLKARYEEKRAQNEAQQVKIREWRRNHASELNI